MCTSIRLTMTTICVWLHWAHNESHEAFEQRTFAHCSSCWIHKDKGGFFVLMKQYDLPLKSKKVVRVDRGCGRQYRQDTFQFHSKCTRHSFSDGVCFSCQWEHPHQSHTSHKTLAPPPPKPLFSSISLITKVVPKQKVSLASLYGGYTSGQREEGERIVPGLCDTVSRGFLQRFCISHWVEASLFH